MERIEGLKWLGTAFILSGILNDKFEYLSSKYFLHGAGVVFGLLQVTSLKINQF